MTLYLYSNINHVSRHVFPTFQLFLVASPVLIHIPTTNLIIIMYIKPTITFTIMETILVIFVCILFINFHSINSTRTRNKPIVEILNGKIRGVTSYSREGRIYYEFLGIPYGKPPIGNLRFESPQPVDNWDEILDTNHYKSECIQIDVLVTGRILGMEDCLFLNVFTPQFKPHKLMPVMVYIHGGLFMSGSSNMYRGKYFMDKNIVLVTMNYRLGALGFLSTGDGAIRGNMGLRDQILALKWVQQNIYIFGGDPKSVTLFGESAGAACVQYLMLSPLSKGLFHRGISQSGIAIRKYTLTDDQNLQAKHFAMQIQCPITSTKEMIDCLKSADADTIVQIHREALSPERNIYSIFAPIVEYLKDSETIVLENPIQILKNGNFTKMPWIVGVNSGEGLLYVAQMLRSQPLLNKLENDWNTIFPKLLRLNTNYTNVSKKIREYYFGNSTYLNIKDNIQNFTNMFSDRYFFQPTKMAIHLHAKYSPGYIYYFSYKTPITFFDVVLGVTPSGYHPPEIEIVNYFTRRWIREKLNRNPRPFYGACHADEVSMLFNTHRISEIKQKSKHYPLSRDMIKLWTDFARDDSFLTFQQIPWNPINLNEPIPVYMEIRASGRLIYEPFTERVKFWESLNIID